MKIRRLPPFEECYTVTADNCWVWNYGKAWNGYGLLKVAGEQRRAHRYAWERAHGPIPEGLLVLHRCDNPPCVNPAHLFLGTTQTNVTDKMQKGRFVSCPGERNGTAKLTQKQVLRIRTLLNQGVFHKTIAAEFDVSPTLVWRIKVGRAWSWL